MHDKLNDWSPTTTLSSPPQKEDGHYNQMQKSRTVAQDLRIDAGVEQACSAREPGFQVAAS